MFYFFAKYPVYALLFPTARTDWIVEQCDLKELNSMSWRMSPKKLICFDLLKNSHHALLLPTARPHTNWIVKQCENEKKTRQTQVCPRGQ